MYPTWHDADKREDQIRMELKVWNRLAGLEMHGSPRSEIRDRAIKWLELFGHPNATESLDYMREQFRLEGEV